MNFNSKAVPMAWPKLSKVLLVMKLTAILIIAALTNVSAKTYSQTVSLRQKNASVEKILRLIEKQTGYHFMYDKKDVAKAGNINIDVDNVSIDQALNKAFNEQPLTYKIFQETIVVKKRDESAPVAEIKAVDITGTVSDAKGPLPGVNVKLKGTDIGTTTDVNGKFKLSVPDANGTLVFSFLGFTTKEVAIGGQTTLNVTMAEESKSLQEVVVVGYGTQKRVDLTGAVGSVSSKTLQERPQTNLEQELAGKIAGVNVSTNSGRPGGNTSVRIRGYASLNTNGNPLYVVDGVVWTEGGNSINPNDVESIDVLKDASSTAIYGTRGANGVILVTTKRGAKNREATVSYDAYVSMSKMAKKLDVLNSKEFLAIEDLAYQNIQKYDPTGWAAGKYADKDPKIKRTALIGKLFDSNLNPLYDTDWQDATTRTAYSQNHNLSVTGGTDKLNYGLFMNYTDDEGIIRNSYSKRYNVRLALDNQVKPWLKIGTTLNYNNTSARFNDGNTGGNNIPRMMIEMIPIVPITYPDGKYGIRQDYPDMESGDNPVALTNEDRRLQQNRVFSGNGYAEIKFIEGLTFKSVFGATISNNTNPYFSSGLVSLSDNFRPYAEVYQYNNNYWQWQNYLTFDRTFNKVHKLNVVAGFERQHYDAFQFNAAAKNIADDLFEYYNLGAGSEPQPPGSDYNQFQMQSFFARANYNYNEKYLLTVTGRYDGSSRVGRNNPYGFFPSAALAWRASQEDFLKDNKTISDLKFRFSYGLTGNSDIGYYSSLATLQSSPYVFGGNRANGITLDNIANPNLSWEKTAETDLGFSLGLFNNRVNLEADVFYKKTKALLLNAPLPYSSGYTTLTSNVGQVSNKGLELTLNTVNIKTDNFTWTSSFNISLIKNKILALGKANDDIYTSPSFLTDFNLLRVGLPVGTFYGQKVLGTWGTSEATEAAKFGKLPGDLKFLDVNGDHQINSQDNVVLGKSTPDGYGTFSNNFAYKGWDLGVELQFVYGNDVMNLTQHSAQDRTGQANSYATVLNAWTPNNQNTSIAEVRPSYVRYDTGIYSTKVQDGSFIRGKSVSLGYTFPTEMVKRIKLNRLRVYAQAQNLFIITKYPGYDPETTTYGDAFAQGIQFFDYPKPRTFVLGASVNF
ncbi:SusC/RagA family TonB-linked outer membrane protein [Mucilaginibacter conchicola]|uniref:SusC/RagA family TonB-linked outer membrane protein n=1 Tax=Mucilaginibacter conchicola TaxID=2303333 RepID=A0A372NPQ5_9SPHI|nr:TonB-dependent receptor [Mucilaginibacter conchicola]RFZ90911.1 SusC/RagA family TonB-linked outer membrane protein [Mucilaginibacter conchicola]